MSVEVKLELGHRAILRENPTVEGFTHDWTVFVKGAEGGNIHNFVDKVVFHLHESFHKPRRVVKEPPYLVSESGYAGFIMPIEVYFRSKEEPKKVRFEYDLYLRLEGAPVSNIRLEKLTFQNPSDDFRRKLLKAGGVGALSASTVPGGASLQTQACAPIQHTEEHRPPSHSKPSAAVAEKKPRHHSAIKEPSKPLPPPVSKGSQPFTEIFGVPIKAKHSPDSTGKIKESGLSSSHQKQSKVSPPRSSSVGNKEPKSISKESHTSDIKEHKPLKSTKGEKEFKSSSKRALAIDNQGSHEKKRKHGSLLSENGEKTGDIVKAKDRKEKHKNRTPSHSNKKDKTKNKLPTALHQNKDISKPNSQVHKEVSPEIHSHETDSNDSKDMSHKFDHNPKSPVLSETSPNYCNPRSPSITISPLSSDTELSPPHAKEKLSNNGHEVEENFFEDKTPEKPAVKSDKNILKPKTKSKLKPPAKVNHANENCVSKENNDHSISVTEETNIHQESTTDPTCIAELKELQRRIMSIEDKQLLQRVVDIIEETGSFQISKTSFDFDLLKLDQNTVHKLNHLTL